MNSQEAARLKTAFSLQQLINNKDGDFEVCGDDLTEEHYDLKFSEVAEYINTDCVGFEDENSNSSTLSPFEKLKTKMTKIDNNGKVMKYIMVQGVGNVVPSNAVVYVHYSMYTEYEGVPFDVTFLRSKEPVRIVLSSTGIIPGLELGIRSMKKSEKAQFLIHHDMAFGKMGCAPRIPGEATILCEVELFRYSENPDTDGFEDLSMLEKTKFSSIKYAKAEYAIGLEYCKDNPRAAAVRFKKALGVLGGLHLLNTEEKQERNELLLQVYSNLALCFCEKDNLVPTQVCVYVKEAFRVCGSKAKNSKTLNKCWGIALYHLNELEESIKCLLIAKKLDPKDTEIQDFLSKIEVKKKQHLENERNICQKMFKFSLDKKENKIKELSESMIILQEQIEAFKSGNQKDLFLPVPITTEEKTFCLDYGKSLKLLANVVNRGNIQAIHLSKPWDPSSF
uniref:peptidylprolyl isomerase n=1 Tax=Clastoptera arizonana TaxID=38151 RepID=A0A1B6C8T7_9HEMI